MISYMISYLTHSLRYNDIVKKDDIIYDIIVVGMISRMISEKQL